jgi:hypothetical protein
MKDDVAGRSVIKRANLQIDAFADAQHGIIKEQYEAAIGYLEHRYQAVPRNTLRPSTGQAQDSTVSNTADSSVVMHPPAKEHRLRRSVVDTRLRGRRKEGCALDRPCIVLNTFHGSTLEMQRLVHDGCYTLGIKHVRPCILNLSADRGLRQCCVTMNT